MRYAKKSAETCTSEKHEKAAEISTGQGKSYLVLFNPFRLWVTVWVRGKAKKFKRIFQSQKQRKVPDFFRNQELFGGDYWTRTNDLLRVKMRRDVKALLLGAFRHFWARFLWVQITALSTVSTR